MTTPTQSPSQPTGWVGVIVFGATVMFMLSIFNIIQGLFAIGEDDVLVATGTGPALWDVSAWGWIHLAIGVLLGLTAFFLFRGAVWSVVVAIVLVVLNASVQMIFLPVYPIWSLVVIAVDLLLLWALTFHGDELRG